MDTESRKKGTVVYHDRIREALGDRTNGHLADTVLSIGIRIEGRHLCVPVRVHYSNHCWTRTRKDEPEERVLFREPRGDWIDERVFCEERWNFSRKLPVLMSSVGHAICLRGGSRELFYRFTSDPHKGSHAGWYVCARLGVRHAHEEITLSVRSVHYRTNRPADTRGAPVRFWALFWDFYRELREQHAWVAAGETKKEPPA